MTLNATAATLASRLRCEGVLPKHGINGWTGEPKERYYALRGWNWKK